MTPPEVPAGATTIGAAVGAAQADRVATGAAEPEEAVTGTPASPASSPCRCLPEGVEGWRACVSCGLPQAPGKEFCGFCGRRWPRDDEA
jgi:hypothetical protein